jgi:hypothetical protein
MQKWHVVALALAGYDAITKIFPVQRLGAGDKGDDAKGVID